MTALNIRPALKGMLLAAIGTAIVALVYAGLQVPQPGGFGALNREEAIEYISYALAAGAFYAAAIWIVRSYRVPAWSLAVVLIAGLAARLLVLAAPPILSTDLYRYVWDGRVQAAGINPYRYIPNDPALAPLRDTTPGPTAIYPNINRVDSAPTIYPPAAQLLFAVIGRISPSIWTVKAAMLAFDLATTAIAIALLRIARRPAVQVLIWAWNPLVIWEFAGGGHIDAFAAAAAALAILLAIRARPAWAGTALGVAVLVKLLPAALFPALWRRWNWRTPAAAAVIIIAGYACYASAGRHIFGYLSGYAQEEELDDGGGFFILRVIKLLSPLPPWAGVAYMAAALVLLAALAAWIMLRPPFPTAAAARAELINRDALILSAALIAVLSPHYPWYLTMLVLPSVLCPAWSALWPSLAGPILYMDFARSNVLSAAIVFLPAIPLAVLDLFAHRWFPPPALLAAPDFLAKGRN